MVLQPEPATYRLQFLHGGARGTHQVLQMTPEPPNVGGRNVTDTTRQVRQWTDKGASTSQLLKTSREQGPGVHAGPRSATPREFYSASSQFQVPSPEESWPPPAGGNTPEPAPGRPPACLRKAGPDKKTVVSSRGTHSPKAPCATACFYLITKHKIKQFLLITPTLSDYVLQIPQPRKSKTVTK